MVNLPFAFSVHHFISSVGADAGFASIIGLAILVLLYFAQARETSTLRDRADEAEQRAEELTARLAQIARAQAQSAQPVPQRPAPAPVARPLMNPSASAVGARASTASPAPGTVAPSAPAGVGAPALAAATRLIPIAADGAPSGPAAPATAVVAPVPATAAGAAATGRPDAVLGGMAASAEAGNGFVDGDPSLAGGGGSRAATPERPPEPPPRVQLRPSGAPARPAAASLRRPPSGRRPTRLGRGLIALLTVLVVAAVVVVLLAVTSGGGGKTAATGATQTTNAPGTHHRAKPKAFNTASVSIAVLNGTATSGLAASVMKRLSSDGYKQGITPTNAASQTQASTAVMYLSGHKADAVRVAKSLKLPSTSVQAIDSGTQTIACPQTTCSIDVVVTVGSDLASR